MPLPQAAAAFKARAEARRRAMLDRSLRVLKEHALAPLADLFRSVPPTSITFGALLVGLLCALAAANRYYQLALLLWGLNRTLDGVGNAKRRVERGFIWNPTSICL